MARKKKKASPAQSDALKYLLNAVEGPHNANFRLDLLTGILSDVAMSGCPKAELVKVEAKILEENSWERCFNIAQSFATEYYARMRRNRRHDEEIPQLDG